MLRKKEKAQGLVEFALILPVLLLLLLGVIEAARVIWAYITVQTAAREAARYAISGRPYAGDSNSPYCLTREGDPNILTPWVCDPYSRTVAIENVAMNRITTSLNVFTPCRSGNYSLCEGVPNAYGVRVIGQYTDELTPSVVITGVGHSGTQGLNVKISAYYNVQMLDPIFDTLMGGNVIPVRAEISMQNEGIDKALGSLPPPQIGNTSGITGSTDTGTGPNGEIIRPLNSPVSQLGTLQVELQNHFNLSGPYDIYLRKDAFLKRICTGVNTLAATNDGTFSCLITGDIPPDTYTLFSTISGNTDPLAISSQDVIVIVSDIPKIQVDNGVGGNIAAANSAVTINLITHQPSNQPFTITVVYGATELQIFTGVSVNLSGPTSIPWTVPLSLLNPTNPCPGGSGTACVIRSYDKDGNLYASGEFYINQPEIVIAGGLRVFAQNETMYITLRGHSPGVQYDLKISDGGSNTTFIGRTNTANANGEVQIPINWTVPQTNWPVGEPTGWPNGTFTISSHPAVGSVPRDPSSMTSSNQIADLQVDISTPTNPYITINGGYTWPAGSFINIQANRHTPADNPYYFNFGSWRVPIPTGSPVNTFNTDSNQVFVAAYRIPLTATLGTATTFTVSSFKNANNNLVASRNVTVLPVPIIRVVQGSLVSPDTIITVQILNHAPDSTYRIIYANKVLGEILTNANGQGQLQYDLRTLPVTPPPDLSNPANYGIPFDMWSQFLISGSGVATTQLALRAADLRVTAIQFPSSPALNTTIPVSFTIQNTSPVTITRFFDSDFYLDPSPLVPSFTAGQFNFPGDYKSWRNFVAPGASFVVTQPFFIGSYGPHQFYGYTDTSNFIFNENSEVNNILSNTLTILCTPTFVTDTFSSLSPTWTTQLYGNADLNNTPPVISSNRLVITSDGSSTTGANDASLAPPRGYTFFRKTTPITTSAGLDIRVQVLGAPNNVNGARAGLELRDGPANDPSNPKLEFGLARSGSGQYRVQVLFRDSVSPVPVSSYQNSTNLSLSTPIWLRIQRYGGTNTFAFYFVQSSSAPTSWGAPVHTATVRLSNQLEYGLFMNNGTNGSHQKATFDNFVVSNPGSCPAALGEQPVDNTPPGLATCTDPLKEQGFETIPSVNWLGIGTQGVQIASGNGRTGNNGLLADTLRSGFNNPIFYQQFQMPAPLISSTTTIKLNMFRNVVNPNGAFPDDNFHAVVTTGPSLASTQVTNPVLVANGSGSATYSPANWQEFTMNLPAASGINFADYAGQNLYLIFYNNSNANKVGCPPVCNDTEFYFDDIKLQPCTVKPKPALITTQIKGELVIHPLGQPSENKAGVRVWAYAEGGELFETVTIQNGEFNFYNLPSTTNGIRYFIYAEHHIISASDPNQIETLTANSSVILTSNNNDLNPVITRLDLY